MQTHLLLWDKRLYQYPNVQEGTCRNRSPVGMSILSLASAIVSAITVVISSPKVLIRAWSSSVQFSRSVVSDSLRPHESQHARPPCPSPTPGFQRLTSIESVMPSSHLILCRPLLLLPPIPPSIRVFSNESTLHMKGQSIGVSASASVLPKNTQDWSPLGWTGWISLQSKGLSRVFSNTTVQKHQFFSAQLSSQSNSHMHTWPLEKP